jgi:drug/metabolite transporter (DMT)-like permease
MPQTLPAQANGDKTVQSSLSKGYAAVFATIAIWSMPSLFQYYLIRYYEPWSQNFYRYSVACLAILPFVCYRRTESWFNRQAFIACFWPCLPNVVHQITQVIALFYMGPGVYAIFTRSSVIFTALLALAFFPEERYVIRQWQFQVGTLLGLVGSFGVIWFQPGWEGGHIALPGLFIAFTATFCCGKAPLRAIRIDPQFRYGQLDHFGTIAAAYSCLWQPGHATPSQLAG